MMISFSYLSIRRIRVVRLPFFSEISRPEREVSPRRSESILTGKPALLRSDFRALLWRQASRLRFCAFRVRRCVLRVAGQFRGNTRRGSPVLDPELWINVFEMFSDSRHRYSQACSNLTFRLH